MVDQLKKTGVVPVLLTGDNNHAASSIAERLHIQEVYSGCLPEDKLAYIDQCESEHQPVCMVGDGVNDAPALKKAAVGIAMGGIGLSLIHICIGHAKIFHRNRCNC